MSASPKHEGYMTPHAHNRLLACRDYVLSALTEAMKSRSGDTGLEWIDRERLAVAVAANEWGTAYGCRRHVTVDDVERVEGRAVGHVDYARKLALYVAERVLLGEPAQ